MRQVTLKTEGRKNDEGNTKVEYIYYKYIINIIITF